MSSRLDRSISFSIIVPVYNKAKYLRSCIESILSQSYQEFEIIAINDGSTDDSLQILNSYADSRLKVIDIPNGGVSRARNIGINSARKDYVTFVDGDDILERDYLQTYHTLITEYNPDIIIGCLSAINPRGETHIIKSGMIPGIYSGPYFCERFIPEMFEHQGVFGFVAAKFIRRSLLRQNQFSFNHNLKLAEDLDFWSRVYLKVESVVITDYAGYRYLTGTENSSVHLSGQQLSQLDLWLRIIRDYASNEGASRKLVLQKINGIIEAHFLELQELSPRQVKQTLHLIDKKTHALRKELKMHARGKLQNQIIGGRTLGVWAYLAARNLYHKLR